MERSVSAPLVSLRADASRTEVSLIADVGVAGRSLSMAAATPAVDAADDNGSSAGESPAIEVAQSPSSDFASTAGSTAESRRQHKPGRQKRSISSRALRLLKSGLRGSRGGKAFSGTSTSSSARTVASAECDSSSCLGGLGPGGDESSLSFRGGVAEEYNDGGSDDGRRPGDSDDGDGDDDDNDEDPEALSEVRALHARGRWMYAGGRPRDALVLHEEALQEMSRRGYVRRGDGDGADVNADNDAGEGGGSEVEVLHARIAHDLARSRFAVAAASSAASSQPRALADQVRISRRALHRAIARRLERRATAAACGGFDDDNDTNTDDIGRLCTGADLLRAAGRIRDETLFEYDSALRNYWEALGMEARAADLLNGRALRRRRDGCRHSPGVGHGREPGPGMGEDRPAAPGDAEEGRIREALRALEARAEETRRMIGRIHYKRGEFGMAVRTSFG